MKIHWSKAAQSAKQRSGGLPAWVWRVIMMCHFTGTFLCVRLYVQYRVTTILFFTTLWRCTSTPARDVSFVTGFFFWQKMTHLLRLLCWMYRSWGSMTSPHWERKNTLALWSRTQGASNGKKKHNDVWLQLFTDNLDFFSGILATTGSHVYFLFLAPT